MTHQSDILQLVELERYSIDNIKDGRGLKFATKCAVKLLIQAAEKVGDFTFLPNVRTGDKRKRKAVDRFLSRNMSDEKTFARGAGTRTLFRGEYSFHGITQIEGSRPRITEIMAYDQVSGRTADDASNIQIFGDRVEPILTAREIGGYDGLVG